MSKILAWHANPALDGSAYYRMLLPFEALAESLQRTEVKFSNTVYPQDLDWADILVGQRVADMGLTTEWLQWAERRSPRLVYDLDDDLLNVDKESPAHAVYGPPESRAALQWAIGSAHHLIVSTRALADRMAVYSMDIRVAPNCVPSWLKPIERPSGKVPIVGWAGSSTHAGDIATIADELRSVSFVLGLRADWHTIGGHRFHVQGAHYRHTEWTPGVAAYLKAIDFDICVIPLADTKFNESKSDIKAREMAALGIPVIAANHPVYRNTVLDGVTGWLYDSPVEMSAAVRTLVNDRSLRERMGKAARQLAEAEFMIDNPRNLQAWSAALIRERA